LAGSRRSQTQQADGRKQKDRELAEAAVRGSGMIDIDRVLSAAI